MIGALILGLVAGFLGRGLLPGKQHMGLVATVLLGLAGAALGYLVFTVLLGIGDTEAFDLGSLPGAIIGAVALLWAYERFIASKGPAAGSPEPPGGGGDSAAHGGRGERQRERDQRRERKNR